QLSGNVTVGGSFTVTSPAASIMQVTGALNVGGNSSLDAGVFGIELPTSLNTFGGPVTAVASGKINIAGTGHLIVNGICLAGCTTTVAALTGGFELATVVSTLPTNGVYPLFPVADTTTAAT